MKRHLVLVSGLASNERLWRHQVEHLGNEASIVIVSPVQNTAEKMVRVVLEEAPETFALAGHSMGGWVCLEIMRAAPERVTKLCLLNTTARSDSTEKKAKRKEMIARAKAGEFPKIAKELAEKFVWNTDVKSDVETMFLEVGAQAFIDQEEAMLDRMESLSILPKILCPTLVIHAEQDSNFSLEEHKELASKIPNAKLTVIEGSGHMSPLEKPQAVTDLLRSGLF